MRTKKIGVFMLAGLMAYLFGCRQETDEKGTSEFERDRKERDMQEALNLVTNWQSHFDHFYVKSTRFEIKLGQKIANETDNNRYRKYMDQFIDAAFGIPTDAEESGARLQQLDSFCMMTAAVQGCAEAHRDWNTYWTIALRRLERIRDEMQRLKIRFPDYALQSEGVPVLGRGGWENCLKLTENEYAMAVRGLSWSINDILMTNVLSYEKWRDIHSRLEKIVGHEVEIRPSILKLWEEERKKEQKASVGVAATKGSPRGGVEAR